MVRAMKLVNDPNLLAQLNGGGQEVTDPALLAQLNGDSASANKPQASQGMVNFVKNNPRIANAMAALNDNPIFNGLARAAGVIDAGAAETQRNLFNAPHDIVNAVSPKAASYLPTPLPKRDDYADFGVQNPSTMEKIAGTTFGSLPYLLAPGGGRTFAERARMAAIQGGGYGLTQTPNNPFAGGVGGTALGAVSEVIPPVLGAIGKGISAAGNKVLQPFKPQQYADEIIQNLGVGKTLENNSKSLAQDIKSAYETRLNEAKSLYDPVFNEVEGRPLASNAYQQLDDKILKNYNFDLNDLHTVFSENPTLRAAHELQSQLGSEIRQLAKNPAPDIATRNTMQAYKRAQDAVKSDMNDFLTTVDPSIRNQYQKASEHFATHVAPYRDNRNILKIATEDITNPRNLTTIFKNPEPEVQKILGDLPENAPYKILYQELGKTTATTKPESLVKAFEKLEDKGLGSYVTPELAKKMEKLGAKITRRDFATRGMGAIAGAFGAHLIPGAEMAPMVAEGLGALLGSSIAPNAMSVINRARPTMSAVSSNRLRNLYDISAKAAIANSLHYLGGQ
jgi:hypothetical protein